VKNRQVQEGEERKDSSPECPACNSKKFTFKKTSEKMKSCIKSLVESHSCEIFFESDETPGNDP
jgi:ribosomal protein L37AE/L43A